MRSAAETSSIVPFDTWLLVWDDRLELRPRHGFLGLADDRSRGE
jgi:hypothetical protein